MSGEKTIFRRVQIAGLFIISFLGGLVHMSMHSMLVEGELLGWAEKLLYALKAGGATLPLAADVAELPALEMMTGGMLYVAVFWFALMLLPAILPLLTEKRAWRWVTAIVGLVMVVMGIFDSFVHMTTPGQAALGLSGLMLGSIPGIIAVIFAFGWARAEE